MPTKTIILCSIAALIVGILLIVIFFCISITKDDIAKKIREVSHYGELDALSKITEMKIWKLESAINQYALAHNQIPKRLKFLVDCKQTPELANCQAMVELDDLRDAWNKPFDYFIDNNAITLISYGKDGIENNGDDIKKVIELTLR